MARMLHLLGKEVLVLCSHPFGKYSGDALVNYQILTHLPVNIQPFSESLAEDYLIHQPLLIDALLGTGIQSHLRPPISNIIEFFRGKNAVTVAVDLPSGLNADTGKIINQPLAAHHTLTFQLPKICHALSPASDMCGVVHVLDIGIWPDVIEGLKIKREWLDIGFVRRHYKRRAPSSHKGSFGHVLAVGGSRFMAGSIAMTALSAVHAGAGLCTVLTVEACRQTVLQICPEAMCIDVAGDTLDENAVEVFRDALSGKDAVIIGPGLGMNSGSLSFLQKALKEIQVPLLLDADALNLLAAHPELSQFLPPETILTPHPGEMTRLQPIPDPKTQRLEAAEAFARKWQVNVVLKGKGTVIAGKNGNTWINTSGNPGLASGGTGDVLAGAIGALMAQQYAPHEAACLGVYLHGLAADLLKEDYGEEGVTATKVAYTLPKGLKICLESNA
jgi:NAD(P)H-hydrate epimerase